MGRGSVRHPLPGEYRRQIPAGPLFNKVNQVLDDEKLNTICVSGKCPNRGECFSRGSLAFMVLGDICTRSCGFCAVKAGRPDQADSEEPERLGRAAAALQLRHVVVTAVARDDMPDGGAAHFSACVRALRRHVPDAVVELLTSDLGGDPAALDTVLQAGPDIFNHNIETVERLTPRVRSKATYQRSLDLLRFAKDRLDPGFRRGDTRHSIESRNPKNRKTKSGFMLGLGETGEEIAQTLRDLREAGCDYLTIGQYLQPSARHLSIQSFVPIEDFNYWKREAFGLGFERVASGPLVRSSYFADRLHELTER